jgi:hypothetical protein
MTDFLDDDPQVARYERLRKERGQAAAREYLSEQLRLLGGIGQIAADIVDPNTKAPRGRPAGGHLDSVWHEIGQDFDRLERTGIKAEDAYSALADEYGMGKRTIENLVRSYRSEMDAAHEQADAWQEERDSWPAGEKRAYWREYHREMAESQGDPAFANWLAELPKLEQLRKDEEKQLMRLCPHGCTEGCRRNNMLEGRHQCPFSATPRNKLRK